MSQDERREKHHCHARGCKVRVPPEMLMCRRHWFMVPKLLRDRVWATYRAGQCDDMNPSVAWHQAADAAIQAVWEKERLKRDDGSANGRPPGSEPGNGGSNPSPSTCDRCGGPVENGRGFIVLCRTCRRIIDEQLEKGRFLG